MRSNFGYLSRMYTNRDELIEIMKGGNRSKKLYGTTGNGLPHHSKILYMSNLIESHVTDKYTRWAWNTYILSQVGLIVSNNLINIDKTILRVMEKHGVFL